MMRQHRTAMFVSLWIVLAMVGFSVCDEKKKPDCTRLRIVNKGTGGDLNYYVQMTCKLMDLDRDDFDKGDKHCGFFYKNMTNGRVRRNEWTKVESTYIIQSSNIVTASNTVQVTCLLSIWVSRLKNCSYKFKFASPQNDDEYKSFESINAITLRAPKVEIINCPTGESVQGGYIKVGTDATCGCRLVDKGNPEARVQWIGSDARVKATDNNIAKLTLMASKDLHDTNYDCMGKSADSEDYEDRVQYRANIAYGPEKVYINGMTKPFTLCPKSQLTINITCDVLKPYNPDVKVSLRGLEKDTIIDLGGRNISGHRRFSFSVSPKMGGVYSVACVAVNSIFKDLSAEKSGSITVEAPPPQPPVLTINNGAPLTNGQTVNVTLNQTVTFNCKVKGGYPKVSYTNLKYGSGHIRKNKVFSGDEVTDSFDVTEEFDGKKVECYAIHKTGCYKHTTSVTLNVKGPFRLYANQTTSDFQGTAGEEMTIAIFITGFQEPKEDEIKLYKVTDVGQHTVSKLTDDDTDDGRYTLSHQEVKEGHWNLTLTFSSLAESDSGKYQLEIDNGVEPNLICKFDIKVYKNDAKIYEFGRRENISQSKIEVEVNANITLVCTAGGRPLPSVTITSSNMGDHPLGVPQTSEGPNRTVEFTKNNLGCQDTATYTCTAANNVSHDQKEVSVGVRCPFRLYANQTTSDFQGTTGQEMTIAIFITGFKEPKEDEIKLYKGTYEGQHTIRQLTDDDTDDGRYTLFPQEVKEGHWKLSLTFSSLTESDSGQYQLEIDNGVEPKLMYKFDIKVDKSTLPSKTSFLLYILVAVGVIVVLIIIIVIVIVRKKCSKNSGQLSEHEKNKGSTEGNAAQTSGVHYKNNVYDMQLPNRGDTGKVVIQNIASADDEEDEESVVMIRNDIYGMGPDNDVGLQNIAPTGGEEDDEPEVMIRNDIYGMGPDNDDRSSGVEYKNSLYGMPLPNDEEEVMIVNDIYGMELNTGANNAPMPQVLPSQRGTDLSEQEDIYNQIDD